MKNKRYLKFFGEISIQAVYTLSTAEVYEVYHMKYNGWILQLADLQQLLRQLGCSYLVFIVVLFVVLSETTFTDL